MSKEVKSIEQRIEEQRKYLRKLEAVQSVLEHAEQQRKWYMRTVYDAETGEVLTDEKGDNILEAPEPSNWDYGYYAIWGEIIELLKNM